MVYTQQAPQQNQQQNRVDTYLGRNNNGYQGNGNGNGNAQVVPVNPVPKMQNSEEIANCIAQKIGAAYGQPPAFSKAKARRKVWYALRSLLTSDISYKHQNQQIDWTSFNQSFVDVFGTVDHPTYSATQMAQVGAMFSLEVSRTDPEKAVNDMIAINDRTWERKNQRQQQQQQQGNGNGNGSQDQPITPYYGADDEEF